MFSNNFSKFQEEVINAFRQRCFIVDVLNLDIALEENHCDKVFSHAFYITIQDKKATFPNMDVADNHQFGIYTKLANKAMSEITTKKNLKKFNWNFYRHSGLNAIVFLCGEK